MRPCLMFHRGFICYVAVMKFKLFMCMLFFYPQKKKLIQHLFYISIFPEKKGSHIEEACFSSYKLIHYISTKPNNNSEEDETTRKRREYSNEDNENHLLFFLQWLNIIFTFFLLCNFIFLNLMRSVV